MVRGHVIRIALVLVLLVTATGLFATGVGAADPLYHTVRFGETLSAIARMYGVTTQALAEANNIKNRNLIFAGQRLLIPAPADQVVIHVVARGETLLSIAAQYGMSAQAIASRNNIRNPNLIFVGQRLVIPTGGAPQPTPATVPGPGTPPTVQEALIISSPTLNAEIRSPVTVTGWGSGFENTLAIDILDQAGNTIGQGSATVVAAIGQIGPFTATVTFTMPSTAQPGRIQVYSISPRDGAIEHLASVSVNLKP